MTLYIAAMLYVFLGIAMASDVFMSSIERITARKRKISVYDDLTGKAVEREIFVWNETVANLTLMALGSSAPEILLSVVESISKLKSIDEGVHEDSLGLFTIIGSAAFNLMIISSICIVSVPSPNPKRIKEFSVFIMTSAFSIFAYIWMLLTLVLISPQVIELWEAVLTLAFFPIMVLCAFAQDNNWWLDTLKNKKMINVNSKNAVNGLKENANDQVTQVSNIFQHIFHLDLLKLIGSFIILLSLTTSLINMRILLH
ncbi:unnamed protein product [Protopolystoma xenopodis]|uniref:Sodium/calcium exchanger membrane region domain-containing protein n=1 Tax=Protopolystoma xenopodis TaxID=117903 RepID=A0A448X6J8_9PLAT|nr:unnamed protein product [Protopolystoma xenopodis]